LRCNATHATRSPAPTAPSVGKARATAYTGRIHLRLLALARSDHPEELFLALKPNASTRSVRFG